MELEEESKKVAKKEELDGRKSGSLAWRTSRGETSVTMNKINSSLSKFFI